MKRLLESADRLLRPIERAMAYFAGIVVLVLMVLGVAEVIGRSMLNAPIHGNLDIVEQLMIPVAAFGIAYGQSKFGNVRMTLLTNRFGDRAKWVAEAIALAVGLFVTYVFLQGSFLKLMRALSLGGDTPEIGIPLSYGMGGVAAALALLLARLAVQLLEALRLILSPTAESSIFGQTAH